MPHFAVEYTDDIKPVVDIAALLTRINATLIAQDGAFPTGCIRSRAIELCDYRIADGSADDAFVRATLKIGAGRRDPVKKRMCELFAVIKDHFAGLFAKRNLALSLDLIERHETFSYKHNNIRARFNKP